MGSSSTRETPSASSSPWLESTCTPSHSRARAPRARSSGALDSAESLRLLGALLGWLAGGVLRIRRGHVEDSMRTAGIGRPSSAARAMYASLGMSAVEFLWMAFRGRSALGKVGFDEASRVRWEEALGQGRGGVVG